MIREADRDESVRSAATDDEGARIRPLIEPAGQVGRARFAVAEE
jgi:hypothetical protein